jgi:tRNA pseudouridine55 synthase
VHVYSHRIDGIDLPNIDFTVKCTKGFYVRTYAHDIGQELGCGAHLSRLRRTRSGRFDLERAVTFDDLKHGDRDDIIEKMLSLPEVSKIRGA